jgi:hypothetical protein
MDIVGRIDTLMTAYDIEDLTVLENVKHGHNKVYILTRLKVGDDMVMVRLWGGHDKTLSPKTELINGVAEYDKLIDEKLSTKHGYESVSFGDEMPDYEQRRYENYFRALERELKAAKDLTVAISPL